MKKTVLVILTMALAPFSFAVDGVVLINQSTVMAAGGFPYNITLSGSYRLSGNLTVPTVNTSALVISVDNVTIDLNGFSIIGPTVCVGFPVTSCSPTGTGVGVSALVPSNITVVNGTIRGMSQGVILGGFGGYVEKVHTDSNSAGGINVSSGLVIGNTANNNGFTGFTIGAGVTLSGNTATGNHTKGLNIVCPSTVVNNTAVSNGVDNVVLFGTGCAVANNAAP